MPFGASGGSPDRPPGRSAPASVDLYWLPLGADGNPFVRVGGRAYEAVVALRERRPRAALFHSALLVRLDGATYVIEMAPVWSAKSPDRGVVGVGPVGLPFLGRSRLFRYEIRRWRDGVLADIDQAVGSPVRLGSSEHQTRAVLDLVPRCPTPTWGLDELHTGEMWNSNSLVAWLLASNGLVTPGSAPLERGRAPGWQAGLRAAQRQLTR